MTSPTWTLSEDRKLVIVTFPTTPEVRLELPAEEVAKLIAGLCELRAHLEPPVPMEFPLGQAVGAISDPRWAAEPELLLGQSLLHLRHPGLGWLHFVLPQNEARTLGQLLQAQADAPLPGQSSGMAN